jgi:hypothetical protein
MLPLTWQQNDLSWSLNVEWIVKNPLFYGFVALFQDWGCGGQGCYFQPNQSVISQMSASHECTDTVVMAKKCIFDGLISVYFRAYRVGTPCIKNLKFRGWCSEFRRVPGTRGTRANRLNRALL